MKQLKGKNGRRGKEQNERRNAKKISWKGKRGKEKE